MLHWERYWQKDDKKWGYLDGTNKRYSWKIFSEGKCNRSPKKLIIIYFHLLQCMFKNYIGSPTTPHTHKKTTMKVCSPPYTRGMLSLVQNQNPGSLQTLFLSTLQLSRDLESATSPIIKQWRWAIHAWSKYQIHESPHTSHRPCYF